MGGPDAHVVAAKDRMEHYGGHADKSSSTDVERYLKPFRELMGHGATLVLLTHQTQHYERMEGHQSLEGSFDHVIKLSAIEGDPGTVEWEDTSVPSQKHV